MSELAEYRSHKIVKAGKIKMFAANLVVVVEDCNSEDYVIEMSGNDWARGRPSIGDYIVIYSDSYKSWSPAKVFEEGYTRI